MTAPGRKLLRHAARVAGLIALVGAASCSQAADTASGRGGDGGPEGAVRLTLLGTTDVHGHLLPWDYAGDSATDRGSLAQIATLVDSIRGADPHVLLFDSGDLLQGTPLNDYQAEHGPDDPHPVIGAMNAAGYDAAVLGNHEFDYGIEFLERSLAAASVPFLSGNTYAAGSDSTAWPPYVVLEAGGVRVGVLGLTTPGVAVWNRHHVEERLRFGDIVEAGRRWVPHLRGPQRADVVVVLAHSGLGPGSSYAEPGVPEENAVERLLREVPGIDVVFLGHSHREIEQERVGDALVVQAGPHARSLAVVHLTFHREDGSARVAVDGRLLQAAGVSPHARVVAAVRDAQERTASWLGEILAWTPDAWSAATARYEDRPIADLITAAQRQATGADLSSTAIFDPDVSFGPGPITRRDVLALYVYPNSLRAVRIDGAALRAYLERSALYFHSWPAERLVNDSVPGFNFDVVSGVEYALDLRRPPGERVAWLRRGGRDVTPRDSFTMALNSYRQAGGGGFDMVRTAPVVYAGERGIQSLLVDYIVARDTLRHADVFVENWRLLPSEAVEALKAEAAQAAHASRRR